MSLKGMVDPFSSFCRIDGDRKYTPRFLKTTKTTPLYRGDVLMVAANFRFETIKLANNNSPPMEGGL
jgi:hypothetical protein